MGIVEKPVLFLMKYLVGTCETFFGEEKMNFLMKLIIKYCVFEGYFMKLLEKYIALLCEWSIYNKKDQCLSQKMNV